jgi:hypothetical protein
MYEGKSKSNGTFQEKRIYYRYTQTELTLHFNVTPLDFNAPVPAFHKFLIPSEKKNLVASLTNFVPRQFLEQIVTADETWVHHYEPERKAQSMAWKPPDITRG